MTDINTEYKSRFNALTKQLGRVPDTRDKEWWVLTEWMRKEWTRWTGTTRTTAESATARSTADSRTKSATAAEGSASTTDSATTATDARGLPNDAIRPTRQVGKPSTSWGTGPGRGATGTRGTPVDERPPNVRREAGDDQVGSYPLSTPRLTADGSEAATQLDGPSVDPGNSERAMAADLASSPARGPSGGVMATCTDCGRAWERPVSRGRPARRCGECR